LASIQATSSGQKDRKKVEEISELAKAPEIPLSELDFDPSDPQCIVTQRMISGRRGSWWQFPKAALIEHEKRELEKQKKNRFSDERIGNGK
jgi:hypothetical protein